MREIRFLSTTPEYKELSNFYRCRIELGGEVWSSVEHYFQAMKFEGKPYADVIRMAATAGEAARLGKSRQHPIRSDWNAVREDIMYYALSAKFVQNAALKALLLATGDAVLIESNPYDYYWGEGAKRTGQNRLGKLLMELRNDLRC